MTDVAIGIDLGTTYSCVGIWKNNHIQILVNKEGSRLTPSCVSYVGDSEEILIGDAALSRLTGHPQNTIYDMKRVLGKKIIDDKLTKSKKFWAFDLKAIDNQLLAVEVEHNNIKRLVKPIEVSSLVLKKMKETAERVLRHKVTKAVITVPAYFNQSQRKETINAANLAELEVLELITEPAAAAYAFGFESRDLKKL